jgi:2-haloalkanoic acid dehalogenase type II
MVKAIIFDCWNTLFFKDSKLINFIEFVNKISKKFFNKDYLKIFEKNFMLEKYNDFDIPIKNMLNELHIRPYKRLIKILKKILNKGMEKPFSDTLKVLNELKKDYKLGLITNTTYKNYNQLNKKFNLNKIFDIVLKSYETKILKPDTKIFEIALKKLKLKKNEVIMVGNSLKYDINSAKKFGIKAILIDRKEKNLKYKKRISSLKELKDFL